MSQKGIKKKITYEDKFARKYYCQHARLNSIRRDKLQAKKKIRTINKKIIQENLINKI